MRRSVSRVVVTYRILPSVRFVPLLEILLELLRLPVPDLDRANVVIRSLNLNGTVANVLAFQLSVSTLFAVEVGQRRTHRPFLSML